MSDTKANDSERYWVVVKVVGYDFEDEVGVITPVFWSTDRRDVEAYFNSYKQDNPNISTYPKYWKFAPTFDERDNGGFHKVAPQHAHGHLGEVVERVRQAAREQIRQTEQEHDLNSLEMPETEEVWARRNADPNKVVFIEDYIRNRHEPKR